MTENVQCPVCTLYLHAGMNLSDHLETHPKEQVIRALVQMTISGNGVGSSSALASVLAADNSNTGSGSKKSNNNDLDEKPLPNNKQDNELNINSVGNSCSASPSNSTSNGSIANQSISSNSQNSNNVLNFSATKNERNKETERDKCKATSSSTTTLTAKAIIKTETTNTVVMTKENIMTANTNENVNQCFNNQQNNTSNLTANTNSSLSYHSNTVELTNTSQIHNSNNFNMFSGNSRYDHQQQQRNGVNNQNQQPTPPHMPPPPAPAPVSTQGQHAGQHHELGRGSIIPASSSNGTFHSLQPQKLQPPPPPHHTSSHLGNTSSSSHRPAHMFATGQPQAPPSNSHHQQQQSLKVIYTPNLPPPPPLQLFTYQPQTHLQHHQKPPPAYGTAISQIRSQHNQSKHQVTGSLATTQHQNQTHTILHQQQHNLQQQQMLQHNIRNQVPPPPPPIPIQTKHTYSSKNNNLSIQQHPTAAITPSSSRHNGHLNQQHQQISKTDLNHQQHQQQSQSNSDNAQSSNSSQIFNSQDISNKSTKGGITISAIGPNHNNNSSVTPSYPQVSISPSVASASMAAVAASTLSRHTNSPFAALLAAAAGAPSPSNAASSVLRYAESPVAHYLERDNGDFIVQETPKHIVECVETDNGEFSVIERIYQSPPSVLHIHDDDEEDDEEDHNNDHNKRSGQTVKEQEEIAEHKSKHNDLHTDKIKDQTIGEKQKHKKDDKTTIEVNKNNKKSKINEDEESNSDNDIVDFVSISSDSGDEEEFIAQEKKQQKNTTDKNKNNNSSSTSTTSNTTTSNSTSSISATNSVSDEQPSTSSSTSSSLSCSATTNNSQTQQNNSGPSTSNTTNIRKKSSKNTITVLSDVQLNLNEYLDLVGNIIASSKVAAAQRKTFASIAPIPLVKIEKEEPMDEYTTVTPTKNNFETSLPPPTTPLRANKHETDEITDTASCSNNNNNNNRKQTINNPNVSLTNDPECDENDEQEEKKPQVFANETTTSNSISNTTSSQMTLNSSHVTSVIRMATTSQPQHQLNPQSQSPTQQVNTSSDGNTNANQAEDLSQSQRKIVPIQTPLARKGPKKLVIKPKSSKTDISSSNSSSIATATKPNENQVRDNQQEMPTTSSKARQNLTKQSSLTEEDVTDVKVKNEPITSITYENQQPHTSHATYQSSANGLSILEQHLNSKEPILEFKEEKPCIQETTVPTPPTTIIKEMKVENNVNDDARVLYDFANSKKSQNETTPSTSAPANTFPSPTSLFSSKQTSLVNPINVEQHQQPQQLTKNGNHRINDDNSSSSSNYSSQSAMDATMPSEDNNEHSAPANTQMLQQQTNHIYTDFHFSYLYNNGGNNVTPVAAATNNIKNPSEYTTFYQNPNQTLLLEDSSSSKHYTDFQQQQNQQQQHHQQLQNHHQTTGTSHHQWFNNSNSNNYQTSSEGANITSITSNHSISNINSSGTVLSVDGNSATALDGTEVSKYLDLDSCKREQNIELIVGDRVPPPSSSTSCSFNGATENSMAGICSTAAATLNIRTDEKMPAKGEISEQESNCDIDNSWSQPMYGDISARFFKTTFPGIFPQDNGWNNDEYFTVQDLSASTTAQATNSNSSRLKSFEPSANSSSNNNNNNSCGIPTFSNSNDNCNIDVMPSTSAKIRKRRKRSSQDDKVTQASNKRMQPTSTVTSQQMMMQHQNELTGIEFNFQQLPTHQQQLLQEPSTSSAFLAGPSNANTGFILQQQQQQQLHPLQQQQPQSQQQIQPKQRTKVYECGHCNAKYSKLKDRNAHMVDVHNYIRQNRRLICPTTGLATPLTTTDMQDVALPTTSAASGSMLLSRQMQNTDCMSDNKQGIVKIENDNLQRDLNSLEPINATLSAKSEFLEDDKHLALVPLNGSTNSDCDTKPTTNNLPLSLTTPTSKLTTLYRMLVTFNMTTLKQNQDLSEIDENLIKSSIFFCYVCRQNFNSVKLYDAHLTEHPAECFTCGKKFQRWKNFSLHLKRHLGWKEFGCTVCEKKFVVRSALVEHMRMHSGLSPLKCKVCGKHFKRYSNLTQHRKRHTKKNVRRKEYVCYCGEVLSSKARFLWHKETHDSKPKCCPHCCDRFVHVNSLRRHIRLAHSDKFDYTEPMECPICKQIFAKASMKAHVATHSTETQYDCSICSKSFSTKWNLKIHSWVHANRTAKPFKCEHCPKAFVREVDFKNHMNSHKQIKPYTCEVCGCKFIRKYNYMRHRREHHGNKKYTCDLCKKSFHRHYYLIEHRRIHTGERPFQCTICGKSSTTKTNHNKHLKIHHSRDPFTVEV